MFREAYNMKLLTMQYSPTSHHFLPLRSKYSPQHPFSNTLNICSSLSVRDKTAHLYRTTVKLCEVSGLHLGENSNRVLLGSEAV
jgi:hypothetical protein